MTKLIAGIFIIAFLLVLYLFERYADDKFPFNKKHGGKKMAHTELTASKISDAGSPMILTGSIAFFSESPADFKQCPYCKSTMPLKGGEYKCSHCGYSETAAN